MTTLTLVGPESPSNPFPVGGCLVEFKKGWAGDWIPDLRLRGGKVELHVGGAGNSRFVFERPYGPAVKDEAEVALSAWDRIDLSNCYVRVRAWEDAGGDSPLTVLFVGQVLMAPEKIDSSDNGPQGNQRWVAEGPQGMLERIEVSRSYWAGPFTEIGWLADFNLRKTGAPGSALTGNRAATPDGDTYLFGGTDTWTNLEMLDYVLANLVQQADGPAWTVGGQVDALAQLTSRIRLGDSRTALGILRAIIPTMAGVDFRVVPVEDGFSLDIFTLTEAAASFGDKVLPANSQAVTIDNESPLVEDIELLPTDAKRYDKLRVEGKRGVMTFTALGTSLTPGGTDEVVQGWPDAIETAYRAADDPTRQTPQFDGVFTRFLVNPAWMTNAVLIGDRGLRPKLMGCTDPAGNQLLDPVTPGNVQVIERGTLGHLPLLHGFDYSTDPPTDNNPAGSTPSFATPGFFVKYASKFYEAGNLGAISQYIPPMHVQPLRFDWGVEVKIAPAHVLAKNHWNASTPVPADTIVNPDTIRLPDVTLAPAGLFDWRDCAFTIAIEMDQRIFLEQALPAAEQAGDGSTRVVEIPDAEFWWLAPGTVVGVDSAGQFKVASGGVLRDDTPRLTAAMAGIRAQYLVSRQRGMVKYRTLLNLTGLLGAWATITTAAGDPKIPGAPITSVLYDLDKCVTTVMTGYAK